MNVQQDEQLKQLARVAQKHSPRAQERQLALRKLVNGILTSGRLCRPLSGYFSGVYEDIYDEAVQELLLYVCKNIDKYDPERGEVMAWVNVLLERRFFKEAISKFIDDRNIRLDLGDLDKIPSPISDLSLVETIKQCIELDSEKIFKKEHIENHPRANFQALTRRRLLGKTWKDIGEEFDIKISTVSRFYDRCINKFAPKIKEYCTDI